MTDEVYAASRTKSARRTSAEMEECARFLIDYAERHGSVTVRQLYYRAEVEGLPGIDKTDNGYDKIQRQVLNLRRAGRLPYDHIADLTRWMRKPRTFDSVEEALQETARLYRKALWRDAEVPVEVWCEKEALGAAAICVGIWTGNRVKVNSRSPASSRLSATALHLKARRRASISAAEVA
jgi:hypothetical protein